MLYYLQEVSACTSLIAGYASDYTSGIPRGKVDYLIFGTPFLRAYYTVFKVNDPDNLQRSTVGFAQSFST